MSKKSERLADKLMSGRPEDGLDVNLAMKLMTSMARDHIYPKCAGCVRSSHNAHCAWAFGQCKEGSMFEPKGELKAEVTSIEFRPVNRQCSFHPVTPTFQVRISGAWIDACDTCKNNYEKNYH